VSLSGLLSAALADPALTDAVESVGAPSLTISGPAAIQPFAIAATANTGRMVLAVTSTGREAEDLVSALRCLLPPDQVALYPGWETLPHERLSPRADTVGQRLAVLRRLSHPSGDDPTSGPLAVVVAPVRSLLQPQVPRLGELVPVELHAGDDGCELTQIVTDLVGAGYARSELVDKRGDFAVRGGILDVFPPTEEHPLRIEFWGDEVEEIRYFKVADQRSLEVAEHGLWAPPCRELLLTAAVQERAAVLLAEHPELSELLDPISRGEAVEGMEALAPVLVDDLALVLHELPAGAHVVLCDPERVRARAADLVRTRWYRSGRPGRGLVARAGRRRAAGPRARPAVVGRQRAHLRRPGLRPERVPGVAVLSRRHRCRHGRPAHLDAGRLARRTGL
jgi:transcription-repair coupling factor (superfamily II helicase)